MATILILGGYGLTGRVLTRRLLQESDAAVIVAGRHLEKARQMADGLAAEFGENRVSARTAAAADAASLRAALAGVDLLLVAAPTTQHADTVASTALAAGVDYLDVQLSATKLDVLDALAPEIERTGRCFITEAGYHPGLPAVMIRFAATHLDRLDRAVVAGYLSIQDVPYTAAVDELTEVFRNYDARIFKDRRWVPPGRSYARNIDFGGEIGVRACYPMFFAELAPLPLTYPTLTEVGFYISGMHWLADWVITPLAMAGLKLAPRRAFRSMGRLLWWSMQAFAPRPHQATLLTEASGVKDAKETTVRVTISHPDGYEMTAIPVVACLLQYLDRSARRPGVWMMGHLVDPRRLVTDMQRMGVQTSIAIQPPGRPPRG